MPLFEYQCDSCQKTFEELVMGSKADDVKCPHCNSTQVKKKISSFATKSSGTGFYASDSTACAPSGGT